jgi:hypothetical protein
MALKFLISLSFLSGGCLVALVSAILAAGWGWWQQAWLKRALTFLVPISLSYSLYWLPVWVGQDSSEYAMWAIVCIVPWSVAGVLASTAVTSIIDGCRGKHL